MSQTLFDKDSSSSLDSQYISFGFAWDKFENNLRTELNACCVTFSETAQILDFCDYNQVKIMNGAISLSRESRTKGGPGFNEVISIDLNKVDVSVKAIMILVTCLTAGTFENVKTFNCSVLDSQSKSELFFMKLDKMTDDAGLMMACLYKDEKGGWNVRNVSQPCFGTNFKTCKRAMRDCLTFLIPKDEKTEVSEEQIKDEKELDVLCRNLANLEIFRNITKTIEKKHPTFDLDIRAHGIPKVDLIGSCDGFIKVEIDGKVVHTTEIKKNTLKPHWAVFTLVPPEDLDMNKYQDREKLVHFHLWDHNNLLKNYYVGSVELSYNQLMEAARIESECGRAIVDPKDPKDALGNLVVLPKVTMKVTEVDNPAYDSLVSLRKEVEKKWIK